MLHLKTWILIALCVSVTFVQSENLPKKILSATQVWEESDEYHHKIKTGALNILSYNTWGLPISLSGHDQERRFLDMGSKLLEFKADVIALQETFNSDLRNNLLMTLTKEYFSFSDYRCSRSIIPGVEMDCMGGLMTLSKYPIVDENFYPFPVNKSTSWIEKTGAKGFLISKIKYGNQYIYTINTHLYAGNNAHAESQRKLQIDYIDNFLEKLCLKNENLILLGDFNIHHPCVATSNVYNNITEKLKYIDSKPSITEDDFTIDHTANSFVPSHESRTKLDYVFFSQSFFKRFGILYQSKIMTHSKPYSDHFGWLVNVRNRNWKS